MGLSSSQARLLSLTARQHSVEWKAQKLQAEKLQMANESDRVYNTYLSAINATKIQLKQVDNTGVDTFVDATYKNLLENGYYIQFANDNKLYGLDGAIVDGKKPIEKSDLDDYNLSGPDLELFIAIKNGKKINAGEFSTSKDGYKEVYSAAQLSSLSSGSRYRLMNDITVDATFSPNSLSNITFDGNGHTIKGLQKALFNSLTNSNISNLNISGDINNSQGMLANSVDGGSIQNIKASGSIYSNINQTGGLVGSIRNSDVKNCDINVNITVQNGTLYTGGAFGLVLNTKLNNCSTKGEINGYAFVGGFAGTIQNCDNVTNCTSDTKITLTGDKMIEGTEKGQGYVDSGGFVGTLSKSNIKNCESSGSIENKREWENTTTSNPSHTIAGFVGAISNTTISNSNSYTDVKAIKDYIGGFIGCVNDTITINNCNSYGSLSTGSTECGGFIGHDIRKAGTYNNCYTNDTKHNFCYDRTALTSSTENKNTVTVTPPTISTTETLPNRDAPTELYNLIASGNYYINDHAGNAADGFEDNSNWLTNMLSEGYLYLFKKDPEDGSFYQTNVATDTGLQEVSNTENVKKAEATYENDMKKINRKETKIDTELQQLEAERTSVKTEQDSLKQVIKDNISLTFKLFS